MKDTLLTGEKYKPKSSTSAAEMYKEKERVKEDGKNWPEIKSPNDKRSSNAFSFDYLINQKEYYSDNEAMIKTYKE